MTSADSPTPAEIINAALEFTIPVAHRMGVRAELAEPGHAVLTVPAEGNSNHFGAIYAGVLFTVGEMLGGAISLATFDSSAYYPLVKDLQIFFRKPATTDLRSEAFLAEDEITRIAAEAAANGKSEFQLSATVHDANGVLVAETVGTYQIRTHGR